MPSVITSRRNDWFSPVTCDICNKALGNVPALINHVRGHMEETASNPKAVTPAASTAMGGISLSMSAPPPSFSRSSVYFGLTNPHQSLLSPPSFSLFENSSVSALANHRPTHLALLSSTLPMHYKPKSAFTGPMKSSSNMFAIKETPPTLYNVIPYNRQVANRDILSDGVTRMFINKLDRPVPLIIELTDDSDSEDNDIQKKIPRLDLTLKL